ncbi:2-hydroxyacyl-CoA dehydratase [Halovibrio sp. HP20-50]|uniref:2-hydroxyacyl-CoA dehydratase n=1 Tax=Halovibrio sp. HP20-59 TaxID=3080275 RepID=UPI00294AA053|nr:2-hydroxyacyl-CoA dehydratase [Halovibrio sp. HP20-59]MEA2119324.1 2-hydroxyacyl-CoA dehydratase [Halovibrio sp. HP20-59]
MRYNQVKDLVEWAAGFHERMARQYSDAADSVENERLQMVLTYLASRELKMKTGLDDLLHDDSGHTDVLETWFDDSSEFPQPPELDKLAEQTVTGSIEDVMKTATMAHQRLQALYEHRAERAKIEPEEEFFNALAEGHNSEIRHIMASIEELQGV